MLLHSLWLVTPRTLDPQSLHPPGERHLATPVIRPENGHLATCVARPEDEHLARPGEDEPPVLTVQDDKVFHYLKKYLQSPLCFSVVHRCQIRTCYERMAGFLWVGILQVSLGRRVVSLSWHTTSESWRGGQAYQSLCQQQHRASSILFQNVNFEAW